jgi:DNA-binding NarL/FixJ family response regulator
MPEAERLVHGEQENTHASWSAENGCTTDGKLLSDHAQTEVGSAEANYRPKRVAIIDLCWNGPGEGVALARKLRGKDPGCGIVLISHSPEGTLPLQALEHGIDSLAYLDMSVAEFLSTIRQTASGYRVLPHPTRAWDGERLSKRELQIVSLACEGLGRREIADTLCLTERTIKREIGSLLRKTGYQNLGHLALHAVARGFVVPGISGFDYTAEWLDEPVA